MSFALLETYHYVGSGGLICAELVISFVKEAAAVVNPFLHLKTSKLLQVFNIHVVLIKNQI